MLTSNVNLEDRPVNVLLSKKVTFYFIDSAIKVKDVKLNDINAAKVIMQHDYLASQKNWLPTEKVEASVLIQKNKTYPCMDIYCS